MATMLAGNPDPEDRVMVVPAMVAEVSSIHCLTMSARHNLTAILTALVVLWTGTLMEIAHHDFVPGEGSSVPSFAPHTCGATERHIPLARVHPCIICAQGHQRVSTPPAEFVPEQIIIVAPANLECAQGQPASIAYLFSGKRGPPSRTV